MAKRPTSRTKANDPAAPTPAAPKAKRARANAARAAEPVDASAEAASGAPAEPSAEDIRRRAYERYQQRGGNHGQHFDDWLAAEKELKSKK